MTSSKEVSIEFKKNLLVYLENHPEDWEEIGESITKAKEKIKGKPLRTSLDLLNYLKREGRRRCDTQYSDGEFVLDNLRKWDKLCTRVIGESIR